MEEENSEDRKSEVDIPEDALEDKIENPVQEELELKPADAKKVNFEANEEAIQPTEENNLNEETPLQVPWPDRKRGITDIPCCLIFLIFIAAEIFIAAFGFFNGDPNVFFQSKNSYGEPCGVGNQTDKPYLFFFDMAKCKLSGISLLDCSEPKICLKKCPDVSWSWNNPGSDNESLICTRDVSKPNMGNLNNLVTTKQCAAYYSASYSLFGRCLPKELFKIGNDDQELTDSSGVSLTDRNNNSLTVRELRDSDLILKNLMGSGSKTNLVFVDLKNTWFYIILLVILGVVLTIIICLLMKYLASCMVIFSIVLFILSLLAGSTFCMVMFVEHNDPTKTSRFENVPGNANFLKDKWFWLSIAIIGYFVCILVFFLVIFLRRRIKMTMRIFGLGSKAIGANMSTLFFPFIPLFCQLLVIIFSVLVSFYIFAYTWKIFGSQYFYEPQVVTINLDNSKYHSVENQNYSSLNCGNSSQLNDMSCHFTKATGKGWTYILHGINIFVALWLLAFIDGFQQLSISGAFARWCFDCKSCKINLTRGILNSARYHLGTIANASFILALIRFFRLIVAFFQKKMSETDNACGKYCLSIVQCCCTCLEKVLEFLTRQCYIITATKGYGFWRSIRDLNNIFSDPLQFLANNITVYIIIINRLLVTIIIGVISFFVFSLELPDVDRGIKLPLNYFYVPLIITILATFFISELFFDVFELSVDTVFISMLISRNDKSKLNEHLIHAMEKRFKEDNGPDNGCC